MRIVRLAAGAAGFLMLLSMAAAPALAGHGNGKDNAFGHGKSGKHSSAKHGHGHHAGTWGNSDNAHSNKHGEERGLSRANDVAGAHGEKGRNNAAAHHSSHGDSDSE